MPPFWKIKRELDRIRLQVWLVLGYFYEPIIQYFHDKNFDTRIKVHDGTHQLTSKVVLFLIYQPKGVAKSIYFTCEHLIANGYSPLIISNGRLSDQDLLLLKQQAWKIIERPNYGYDFGGYRDGVKLLKRWQVELNNLIIMNDSIWWPLYEEDNLLRYMESLNLDVCGLKSHQRINSNTPGFVQSYFYLLSGKIFASEKFNKFWSNYQLSNNKHKTVMYGEMLFSNAILINDNAHIFSDIEDVYLASFINNSKKLDNNELYKILLYAAYKDQNCISENSRLILDFNKTEDKSIWRESVINHIITVSRKRDFYTSFIYYIFKYEKYKYIKKNNMQLNAFCKLKLVSAIKNGDINMPNSIIMDELLENINLIKLIYKI